MFLQKVLLNVIYVLILSCGCGFLIKICEEMMEIKNFLERKKTCICSYRFFIYNVVDFKKKAKKS